MLKISANYDGNGLKFLNKEILSISISIAISVWFPVLQMMFNFDVKNSLTFIYNPNSINGNECFDTIFLRNLNAGK